MEKEGQNAMEVGKEEKKESETCPEEKGRRALSIIPFLGLVSFCKVPYTDNDIMTLTLGMPTTKSVGKQSLAGWLPGRLS